MSKLKILLSGTVLLLIFSLFGCIELKQPQVKYSNFNLTGISFEKANLVFNFTINNPNPIGLDEALYDYKLSINGVQLLDAKDIKFKMPGSQVTTINLPVEIKYERVFTTVAKLLESIAAGNKTVPFELNGTFHFDFVALPFNIPFNEKGQIPLPEAPKIEASNLNINSLQNLFGH